MFTERCTIEHSFRRSDDREALFDEIRERGRVRIGELADATGIRPSRIRGMVRGDPPLYSRPLSLVGQGLVSVGIDAAGEFFEVTPLGRGLAM